MNHKTLVKLIVNLVFKVFIGVVFYKLTLALLHHVTLQGFIAAWIAVEVGLKSKFTIDGL